MKGFLAGIAGAIVLSVALAAPAMAEPPPGPIRLGEIGLAAGVKPTLSGGMAVGTVKLAAPRQSFQALLRQELQLALGQSRSDTATVELTGTLAGGYAAVHNNLGQAGLVAEFVLTRDGVEVFRKQLEVSDHWRPAMFGGAAEASVHFAELFEKLARALMADPDFRAAAASG